LYLDSLSAEGIELAPGEYRKSESWLTMKRLPATSALLLTALLFASSAVVAQNLAGPWTIHYNLNGNATDEDCALVVTDNKITGSCKFLDKDRPVTGTVEGNKVTLQHEGE
jgi:hypothetical protein